MATNFPGSLDNGTSLPYPGALSSRNNPSLAGVESNQNDAVIATQAKLGIGASVAASGKLLIGTGAGASAWSGTAPASGLFVGTTDTQTLTNKTLTSPIINSPNITNATITADSISGFTSANSGTVYGVPVAASKINASYLTNNSVTNTQMAISSINYNNLTTDSTWSWQNYTPTWTNVAGGTLLYARYIQIGKTVNFRISYRLAGAGVTGAISVTLPVQANTLYNADDPIVSQAYFLDNAVNLYLAQVTMNNTTSIGIRPLNASGTYGTFGATASALIPFTWGNLDKISIAGTYEGI